MSLRSSPTRKKKRERDPSIVGISLPGSDKSEHVRISRDGQPVSRRIGSKFSDRSITLLGPSLFALIQME